MTDSVTPDLSTRHPTVRFADAMDELRREVAARRRTYPDWITRGRITQAEADHQTALFEALIDDVGRYALFVAHNAAFKGKPIQPPTHSFTWHQRRSAIARELDQRARLYPQWVEKGRMQQSDATRRTDCLAAIADLFDDGFDWHAHNGLRGTYLNVNPTTPAEEQAQADWWAHYTTVMQARGHMAPAQEQLAL